MSGTSTAITSVSGHEAFLLEDLQGLIGLVHDQAQDPEIRCVGDGKSADVDAGFTQDLGHPDQPAALILRKIEICLTIPVSSFVVCLPAAAALNRAGRYIFLLSITRWALPSLRGMVFGSTSLMVAETPSTLSYFGLITFPAAPGP